MLLFRQISQDLAALLAAEKRDHSPRSAAWMVLGMDAFVILATFRIRKWAQRHHIPFLGRMLRFLQTAFYGIELGNEIELGTGVYFVHSVGIVVGGTSSLGPGCKLFGNNTIGTLTDNGCPIIAAHVFIGAGARILGPVQIGEGAKIGANAVVLINVPSDGTAVGVPAIIKRQRQSL